MNQLTNNAQSNTQLDPRVPKKPGLLDYIGNVLSGVSSGMGGLLGEIGRRQANMPGLTDAQGMGLLRANAAGTGQQYLDDIRTRNQLAAATNALGGLTQADQNALLSLPPTIQAQVIQNILEFRNAPSSLTAAPSAVREYQFYENLPDQAAREDYLRVKRANPFIDIGGSFVQPSPVTPGEIVDEIPIGYAPGESPEDRADIATAEAQATSGLDQVLSPAQIRIDEAFANSYAAYEFGAPGEPPGKLTENRNIEIMDSVLADLAGTLTPAQQGEVFGFDPDAEPDRVIPANDLNLTGKIIGQFSPGLRGIGNPESADVQDRIEQVVQQGLRETLGGQFAQQEGDRLIARAFNPAQEESVNIKRLLPLFQLFRNAKAERDRQRAYFLEKQTISNYEPGVYGNLSISDIERALEGEGLPDAPTAAITLEDIGLTAAQIEQYNAGTVPLGLTPEQYDQLSAYEDQR